MLVQFEIRSACRADLAQIQDLYRSMRRPLRPILAAEEYLVASVQEKVVGCAGTHLLEGAGYLYGLAVSREYQRHGIGSSLTEARVDRVARSGGTTAIALAMFWNLRFFRSVGFELIRRADLPVCFSSIDDFKKPALSRSCVVARATGKERP